MRRLLPVAGVAAILGMVVGFTIAFLWLRTVTSPDDRGNVLAKVAKGFVAERRTPGAGIIFFDQPKPYGDWLCRVNSFHVPEKVLTGKIAQGQDWWDDDLVEERLFGVWLRPTKGSAADSARHKACAEFRDFDHTFIVEGSGDPERGAFLLDSIITNLRSGNLRIPLSCAEVDQQGRPATCKAEGVLKSVELRNLRQVESVSEQKIDHGMRRTDRLTLAASPNSLTFVTLTVLSEQKYGKQSASEGDLRSVEVAVERFH